MSRHTSSDTQQVTVPLYIEHNRPFVDLDLTGSDGCIHTARFWVDTGGGAFLITDSLAQRLGVTLGEAIVDEREGTFTHFTPPPVSLAGMAVSLEPAQALVLPAEERLIASMSVDGLIGARVLAQYRVTFDYPHHQFTLATPGPFTPQGTALPTPVHAESCFPRVEVQIAGQTYGMLLDTGASHSMFSFELLKQWADLHPDWPRAYGAVGTANMGIAGREGKMFMLRVPSITVGPYQIEDVSLVARGKEWEQMSEWMTTPIVGALAGNVLRCFRVEIDYAGQTTYLEQFADPDPHDADVVGLILNPPINGEYVVQGIASSSDPLVAQRVEIGDKLLRVDEQAITGLTIPQAVAALRGTPGQTRTLLLERDGQQVQVTVPVSRIL